MNMINTDREPDISNIFVRKATTPEDMEKLYAVRWTGYKRYFEGKDINEIKDNNDQASNATLLIAVDRQDNPIGTIRILDRNKGPIELDSFVDIPSFLSKEEQNCVEATRLSVPKQPNSFAVKVSLWIAFYYYCSDNNIHSMLISARDMFAKDYKNLLFEDVGDKGAYRHSQLGNTEHRTYKCGIQKTIDLMKFFKHWAYDFCIISNHTNINVN